MTEKILTTCPRCQTQLEAEEGLTICGICAHPFKAKADPAMPPVRAKEAFGAVKIMKVILLVPVLVIAAVVFMVTLVDHKDLTSLLGGLCIFTLLALTYFAPTWYARQWKCPSKDAILFVNLLLGWTVLGWIAAWFLAVMDRPKPASPLPLRTLP